MSYARLSDDSQVYVFAGMDGHLYCHWCALGEAGSLGRTTRGMLTHLRAHEAAGHKVPSRAIASIRADAWENWRARFRAKIRDLWFRARRRP